MSEKYLQSFAWLMRLKMTNGSENGGIYGGFIYCTDIGRINEYTRGI